MLIRLANHSLPEHDPYIIPIVGLLTGWGLLVIWRLTSNFGLRQTIWLLICTAILVFFLKLPNLLHLLRRFKYIWLTTGIVLMLLTFVIGVYPGGEGPRLWIGISGIYLQPSEPIKLLILIFLSAYLADHLPVTVSIIRLILPSTIMFMAALTVLLAQRDLGTASIFIVIYLAIIFLASSRRRIVLVGVIFLLIASIAGYYLFRVIHLRVDAWLNPWVDPTGSSYQIIQAMLAFAAGGFIGRGIGMGSPGLVPIPHSDFIAATIGEEFGLTGIILLVCVLALLVVRGFRTSIHARNLYQRFLSAGITVLLVGQSILIMGGNMRLLPLTGVTLPFMSYGGSSLLTSFIAILLLLIISNEKADEPILMERPRAFQFIGSALLLGLLGLALSAGWWSVIRSGDLQTRLDNPRLSIAERYSRRGSIVDHENKPIVITEGSTGSLVRKYLYPSMSSLTGYDDPVYGEAGLEASLDNYLRGLEGNPSSVVWWNHLVYGQPPAGLDIRLSIDLEIQITSDSLLEGHTGAIVMMNSQTGELITLSSYPWIDPNLISEKWSDWMADETSPFINRATQSQYAAGNALGLFLLSQFNEDQLLEITQSDITLNKLNYGDCACSPQEISNIYGEVMCGCPSAVISLIEKLSSERINQMLSVFGLLEQPPFPLPTSIPYTYMEQIAKSSVFFGEQQLTASPLQVARAAGALNNFKQLNMPKLVLARNTPQQSWLAFSHEDSSSVFYNNADNYVQYLDNGSGLYWESVTTVETIKQGMITWYISGTIPTTNSVSYVIVVALEEDNPSVAKYIGSTLLTSLFEK